MKKPILFIAILFAAFSIAAISGCNKTDTPETCSNGVKDGDETGVDCGGSCTACAVTAYRIHTYSYTTYILGVQGNATETYVYDNQGRVNTITYTGSITGVSTYTYGNGTVTLVDYNNITRVYTLNSSGYATSVTIVGGSTYTYLYDSNWHLLDDGTGTGTYLWTGDNMTRTPDLTHFTYLSDKLTTIENVNKGINFLGKGSKNLANSKQYGTGGLYYFAYEYDSQNRVTKATETGNTVLDPSVYTYY